MREGLCIILRTDWHSSSNFINYLYNYLPTWCDQLHRKGPALCHQSPVSTFLWNTPDYGQVDATGPKPQKCPAPPGLDNLIQKYRLYIRSCAWLEILEERNSDVQVNAARDAAPHRLLGEGPIGSTLRTAEAICDFRVSLGKELWECEGHVG